MILAFEILSGMVLNKSTIVTAVSESLKQDTIELIDPNKEIRVIYNFIDEETYVPSRSGNIERRTWYS